ncbi:MAG TPA: hypothetical protein DCZ10_09085, partial [Pelotomaculum sp.]|nr:hypothetical protein [Pelotomaculum sp.]
GHNDSLQATKHKNPLNFFKAYASLKKSLEVRDIFNKVERSYVNITLSGCLYNLKTTSGEDAKKMLYYELKNHILYDLGLTQYPKDYYFSNADYKEMNMILSTSYEEYKKARSLTRP